MEPFLLADDLYFGLEFDAALAKRDFLHVRNQRDDVGGRRPTVIDEEVAVDFRDFRAANSRAFEAELIDEFACRTLFRVLETAARARFARL